MRIPATQNVFVGHSTSEPHTASPTGMQGIQMDSPKAGIRTQMKIELDEILVFAANRIQHQYHLSIQYKMLNICKLCGILG